MFRSTEPPRRPDDLPEYLSRELNRLTGELRDGDAIQFSLSGAWVDTGGEYCPIAVRRDHHMRVFLEGRADGGTRITDSYTLVLTVPTGYRPAGTEVFAATQGTQGQYARVDVDTDGRVKIWQWNGTWISLSGISYQAQR